VPGGGQLVAVSAWQDIQVQPLLPQKLPVFMTAVVVNNPPLIGAYFDNLATVIDFWKPSLFDSWFTAPPIVTPGPALTPKHKHHRTLMDEALSSPHELGATLRAGIGALSRS
jgi:hypothetical protein